MLKLDELKKIAREIISEESEKNNVPVSLFCFETIEYYNSAYFKQNLKEENSLILMPFISRGFVPSDAPIIVLFPDQNIIGSFLGNMREYVLYIKTIYHEFRHLLQNQSYHPDKNFTYENCINFIESIVIYDWGYYLKHHNNLFTENDADLYGINMAYDFLSKKNMLTPNIKKYIDSIKHNFEFRYNNFNPYKLLEKFNEMIKEENKSKYCFSSFLNHSISEIFYDSQGNYKKLNDILSNECFNKIDKKFIYIMFTCKEFFESLDLESLDEKGLKIIMEAIEYNKNDVHSRQSLNEEYLKKKFITKRKFLNAQQSLYDIESNLNKMYLLLLNRFKNNFMSSEYDSRVYENLDQIDSSIGKK